MREDAIMFELRRKGRIIVSLPRARRKGFRPRRLDPCQDQDWEDPIVKEVHETRARILARFGGDFHAYVRHILAGD